MSELLKMARVRDDHEFLLRVAAALAVHAQTLESRANLSAESRALVDWVLANPMSSPEQFYSFVATVPAVAAKINLVDGRIDSSNVTDADIQNIIAQKWDRIAAFSAKRVTVPGPPAAP